METAARDTCGHQLLRTGTPRDEIQQAVDRCWHCIAAEIEAGLIDACGIRIRPSGFYQDIEAYREWHLRHPTCRVLDLHAKVDRH